MKTIDRAFVPPRGTCTRGILELLIVPGAAFAPSKLLARVWIRMNLADKGVVKTHLTDPTRR